MILLSNGAIVRLDLPLVFFMSSDEWETHCIDILQALS
jgi:hypothetical protein